MSGETGTAAESGTEGLSGSKALYLLRAAEFVLATLLGLSVLAVGTVAVIAEVKGTWHWAIHLESTLSYMGVFIGALTALLVPLVLVSLVARKRYDA